MNDFDNVIFERMILFRKCFSIPKIIEIGRSLELPFFLKLPNNWRLDINRLLFELSSGINDDMLTKIFEKYEPWDWPYFHGSVYSFDRNGLKFENYWKSLNIQLKTILNKYGEHAKKVIALISKYSKGFSIEILKINLPLKLRKFDLSNFIEDMFSSGLLVEAYRGNNYVEWKIPEEILPYVLAEIRGEIPKYSKLDDEKLEVSIQEKEKQIDYIHAELERIKLMELEFDSYLSTLLKNRLEETINFGKKFSIRSLEKYLITMFGTILYFDSFLTIAQQYGLANVPVISEFKKDSLGLQTGFNLALFGEPGTGKSYSTRDMILGNNNTSVPKHGLPGRNRYAAGITPARFIRIGQVYADRTWNFIIPEFNDWFKNEGMVEILKLAMERGEIRYELHRETVGPYFFTSFFSVNYNTKVLDRGYRSTIKDPNFQAIEDRMICRLHRSTKDRYSEIAQSRLKIMLGESEFGDMPNKIRDHLTLIYAIETGHELVKDRFGIKNPLITQEMMEKIQDTRKNIFDFLPTEGVPFSARLEDRTIRLASSLSLMEYFNNDNDFIQISEDAQNYSSRFYVEEAAARAGVNIDVQEIINKLRM